MENYEEKMIPTENKGVTPTQLLEKNRLWAESIRNQDANFFHKLSIQQSPEYLWIGCADSRVPANELLGLLPGELFVHRNIANVVVHSDLNCLSVLQFAVDVLKVKHIIVCGHYGCGGVNAAMTGQRVGLADNWLRHVQDVNVKHEKYLGEIHSSHEKLNRLCELNVAEQVINVCQTTILQDAWERGQEVCVHGWVYAIQDGLLKDISTAIDSPEKLNQQLRKKSADMLA